MIILNGTAHKVPLMKNADIGNLERIVCRIT